MKEEPAIANDTGIQNDEDTDTDIETQEFDKDTEQVRLKVLI